MPWEHYAAGDLGVLAPGQDAWDLFVAWRHLASPTADGGAAEVAPLSPADVAALAALPHPRRQAAGDPTSDPPAVQRWLEARQRVPGAGGEAAPVWIETTRWVEVPLPDGGVEYTFFVNCLDDAFLTAAATLDARIAAWGADSPQVAEWLRGQDRVFANCSSGHAIPEALEATQGRPALLLQDRAYQRAAAWFYALDYPRAEAAFRAIGDDRDSPWQQVGRYLVARVQARDGRPREAVTTLRHLLDDPRQAPFHDSIRGLVDHYRQRYAGEELHHRARQGLLASPLPPDLAQTWTDYRLTRPAAPGSSNGRAAGEAGGAERAGPGTAPAGTHLDPWLAALADASAGDPALALEEWQRTRSRPWLVAALAVAPGPVFDVHGGLRQSTPEAASAGPGDTAGTAGERGPRDGTEAGAGPAEAGAGPGGAAGAPMPPGAMPGPGAPGWSEAAVDALLAAAGNVPVGGPADLSAAYHQARLLLGRGWLPEVRALADDVLAHGGPDGGPLRDRATFNRFSVLRAEAAWGLEDFLRHAQLRPYDVGVDSGQWLPIDWQLRYPEADDLPVLLTTAAVLTLNRLSTQELADLARGDVLHPGVRERVARAAWTRATLVGRYDLAKDLAPRIAALEPALAVDMEDFVATGEEDLPFAAALLVLRFPGLHPDVHVGLPRETPLPEIDPLRQNWWCEGALLASPPWFVPPPFLDGAPEEVLEARRREQRILATQEPAPRHLGLAVLERADTRPEDPRVPEALHRVVTATRHGCPVPEGGYGEVSRAAFQRLHQRYPDSPWTARTPYWFD